MVDVRSCRSQEQNSANGFDVHPDAEIYYDPHFLPPEEVHLLFNTLFNECAWERRKARFGHTVPRDEAYYGDPGTQYIYSQRQYLPLSWIPELLLLKVRVDEATPMAAYANLSLPKLPYNAVLCNLYRNGNDSVGLHADAEPEMGPVIGSISLGAERLFRLKRKDGTVAFFERLPSGSLLDYGRRNAEELQARGSKRTHLLRHEREFHLGVLKEPLMP